MDSKKLDVFPMYQKKCIGIRSGCKILFPLKVLDEELSRCIRESPLEIQASVFSMCYF